MFTCMGERHMERGGWLMRRMVLSLAPLPADFVRLLIEQTPGVPEFEVVNARNMSEDQIRRAMAEADAVLADYTYEKRVTSEMIGSARALKLIQQPGPIDLDACRSRGIKVANTAAPSPVSVAEHTLACGLCLLRNLFHAHVTTRLGEWSQTSIRPADLKGKIWGLVGLGRTGREVARRLRAFEVRHVLYHDVLRPTPLAEQELGVEYVMLSDLLGRSDVVSLHAALTPQTRNMIDARALGSMKRGAILINVARHELVDEHALAEAISEGRIAGAAMDVFSEEPLGPYHPLLDVESDRLLLTPHMAGISDRSEDGVITQAAANIARVLRGEEPEFLVT